MNIKDFRKKVFLNSQYCTYYIDNKLTVLAGVMREFGYKCRGKLSAEVLEKIDETYRKYTTIMNCIVGLEIVLYLYAFVFPYYLKLIQLPFFVLALLLSIIPLVFLYLTYISVNCFYENYLKTQIGEFQKVKFKPTIYNIESSAFEKYKKTPKKSVYVVAFMMIAFLYYAFTPVVVDGLISAKQYKVALSVANVYSKIVPIFSDIYAQRAYAKFKLKKFEDAVSDFQLANEYSNSNVYGLDILGVKTYYLSFNDMVKGFDKEIAHREDEVEKGFLQAEKANYLMKNKKYADALAIYNSLIASYVKGDDTAFAPDEVYFHRGKARQLTGDVIGAQNDFIITKKMCQSCVFDLETNLVNKP